MKRIILWVLTVAFIGSVVAESPLIQAGEKQVYRERIEWCDVWVPEADKEALPRVLLVGDSITRGYYNAVTKNLASRAYVARLTTSRSVCDPLFLAELKPVVEGYKWAVIHFNNGIHGQRYNDQEYEAGLKKAIEYLRQAAPEAKLILVLSTPPAPKAAQKEKELIVRRNEIVKKLAKQYKLPVDDLYTPMHGRADIYRDRYHFKRPAILEQGKLVADVIKELLQNKQK